MNLGQAQTIAVAMGCTASIMHPDHGDTGHYTLTDSEGRTFSIREGTYSTDKGRVIVSGSWPSYDGSKHGRVISPSQLKDEEAPRITIAASKSLEAITRDIQGRFMTDFRRVYDKCKDQGAAELASEREAHAMKQVIEDGYGKPLSETEMRHDAAMYLYGLPKGSFRDVRVHAYNHTVSGQFSSIPLDVFLDLIKLLKGEKP